MDMCEIQALVRTFLEARARQEWLYEKADVAALTGGSLPVGMLDLLSDSAENARFRQENGFLFADFQADYTLSNCTEEDAFVLLRVDECVSFLMQNGNGERTYVGEAYDAIVRQTPDGRKFLDLRRVALAPLPDEAPNTLPHTVPMTGTMTRLSFTLSTPQTTR